MKQNFSAKLFLKLKGAMTAAINKISRPNTDGPELEFADAWKGLRAKFAPAPQQRESGAPVTGADNFIAGSYTHLCGSLKYHVFVPSNYHADMPLMVMLHGCAQDAEIFAAGTGMNELARQLGFVVLYPTQSRMANTNQCWNWFKSGNQHRDMGEPAVIADLTREIMETYQINPDKVFIAGLSAGGAMAYIVGSQYPELYAAIGVHSGLLYRGITNMFSAMAAMKTGSEQVGQIEELQTQFMDYAMSQAPVSQTAVPLIVFHGDNDLVVDAQNAADLMAYHHQQSSFEQRQDKESAQPYSYTRTTYQNEQGENLAEQWIIHGAGHAWSGGCEEGSFADANGPDASAEMMRFFMQ